MKKLLSVMLAILMLAVPVLSMAESAGTTCMTLTFSDVDMTVLGLDEQSAQLVKDVLECIGLRGYALDAAEGAQFGLAVTLQGTDAVTADVIAAEDGVYVASNFLGQDTVLVTYAQLADMLEAYKDMLTAQGMEEAQIDQIVAALRGDKSLVDMGEFDLELTNTLTVLEKLLTNNMGEGDPATAPEGCAAAAAMTVTVSGEEVYELLDALLTDLEASQFMKSFLPAGDEASANKEALAKVRDSIQGDVALTIYMSEDGMPVAVTCAYTTLDETGAAVEVKDIVCLSLMDDAMVVDVYVTVTAEGAVDGMHVQVVVTESSVQIKYMALESDTPFLTVNIAMDEMTAVPAIGTADAVQPLAMTEEALNAWVEGVSTTAQMQLMSVIQLLPSSVLSLMMGGME